MVARSKKVATLERGALIRISFNPVQGHEQSGTRPALVVSDKTFHNATGFALCIPITSKQKSLLFEIEIKGQKVTGVALPHSTRMFDIESREHTFIEMAPKEAVEKAQIILGKIIGL
jgi:mRNA interferase MazF